MIPPLQPHSYPDSAFHLLLLTAFLPALAWYPHSAALFGTPRLLRVPDNAYLWLTALSPTHLLDPSRLQLFARYLS